MSPDSVSNPWPPLPHFPDWPYVIREDDIDYFGDLQHLRKLTDQLEQVCASTDSVVGDLDLNDSWELHVTIAQSQCNWPQDKAEQLIKAWRRERGKIL